MAKVKAPLLSLDAHGTVGEEITYRSKPKQHQALVTPTHVDAQTCPQITQRTRYQQAILEWSWLTPAQKQAYETQARPYHMTGYNLLLRQFLNQQYQGYTHLLAPLNELGQATAHDFSGYTNTGTLVGAYFTPGILCNGVHFDGINDWINFGHDPSLNFSPPFSIELALRPQDVITLQVALTKIAFWGVNGVQFELEIENKNGWFNIFAATLKQCSAPGAFPTPNENYHWVSTYDGSFLRTYVNGTWRGTTASAEGVPSLPTTNVAAGSRYGPTPYKGTEDEIYLYSRLLTPPEIRARAARLGLYVP